MTSVSSVCGRANSENIITNHVITNKYLNSMRTYCRVIYDLDFPLRLNEITNWYFSKTETDNWILLNIRDYRKKIENSKIL